MRTRATTAKDVTTAGEPEPGVLTDALRQTLTLLLDRIVDLNRVDRTLWFPRGVDFVHVRISGADTTLDLKMGSGAIASDLSIAELLTPGQITQTLRQRYKLTELAFVLLPQMSGNGYYSYSPGQNQFGTSQTIDAVLDVARQWQTNPVPVFGVGDISLEQGGIMPPHTTGHRVGRNVDVRPMRTDGQPKQVTWRDAEYSQELTQLLVDNFLAHGNCTKIIFNDPNIAGVQPMADHDNHLHVEMRN